MLEVKNLTKQFKNVQILKGIDFTIEKSEIAIIMGPSGVGKTTFIRCLCGLEPYQSGEIREKNGSRPHIGMVFQTFNLFPHLTVLENITLPLKEVLHMSDADAKVKANELLAKLELTTVREAYPYRLSGGQKQRTAICRALAMEPDYLCFDEPTSALDQGLTDQVGLLLREVAKLSTGVIVITHDIDFAHKYATSLYEMQDGQLQKLR
ncbi:MAG: ATP-binding cassette domain-containing protein [Lachnospiraceae bacterium]|nr:ATP-binding cassette domain-containing protein [Lachnospiraceae bacterium]MDY5742284.1 ATP-binding cassette domain-containing protein [Lachnospiraceae bacterium]